MTAVHVDVDAAGVALLRIDDPARKVNVTSPQLVAELVAAIERLVAAPQVVGIVITSGKAGTFIAGGDIKAFFAACERGITREQAFAIADDWNVAMRRIETCGKPIAAAVNGAALGGGLEFALCCHYRVLVDDAKAVVGQPEVTLGLLPGGGGTQRLPRLIGIEKAVPLLLEGTRLRPHEAHALGIVHDVVRREELVAAARRWVVSRPPAQQPWEASDYRFPGGACAVPSPASRNFIEGMAQAIERTRGAEPAPRAILAAVAEGTQLPLEPGLRVEAKHFAALLTGADARNRIRAWLLART
ncbi:MAG TPA: enoyl-CoA hydratase-related protein [Burkholderiaceae bacterium]|nr:enoyl-CoA hydratase-related protein [Burkholderiaceae bacterium]